MRIQAIGFFGGIMLPTALCAAAVPAPPLMLATRYEAAAVSVADYWVSEKYDGIRAYWDGARLLTRSGHLIHAPRWFTAGWPAEPVDGELWMGRGQFQTVAATVRDVIPNEAEWRGVRFMAFDLPLHAGTFDARSAALAAMAIRLDIPWLQATPQFRVADEIALHAALDRIIAAGGEGLMLHRGLASYRTERSEDLLKLKQIDDAEALVVGYVEGQGKYRGLLGALEVELPTGIRFRVGTGFSDEQRRRPPPVGSWITFGYQGLTEKGVPRFARFLRLREAE